MKPWLRDLARDLLALTGAGCLVVAAGLVSIPLALALAGVILITVAVASKAEGEQGGENAHDPEL